MTYDLVFHASELLVLGSIAYAIIRASNRLQKSLEDYPLHRHAGKRIIYPASVDVEAGNFDTVLILNGDPNGGQRHS